MLTYEKLNSKWNLNEAFCYDENDKNEIEEMFSLKGNIVECVTYGYEHDGNRISSVIKRTEKELGNNLKHAKALFHVLLCGSGVSVFEMINSRAYLYPTFNHEKTEPMGLMKLSEDEDMKGKIKLYTVLFGVENEE